MNDYGAGVVVTFTLLISDNDFVMFVLIRSDCDMLARLLVPFHLVTSSNFALRGLLNEYRATSCH